jgi:hypothetical protein
MSLDDEHTAQGLRGPGRGSGHGGGDHPARHVLRQAEAHRARRHHREGAEEDEPLSARAVGQPTGDRRGQLAHEEGRHDHGHRARPLGRRRDRDHQRDHAVDQQPGERVRGEPRFEPAQRPSA